MTGCATCQGFGYFDDDDETECPACAGRGVSVGVDDLCDDPLCCVSTPADVVTASRNEKQSDAPPMESTAQPRPDGAGSTSSLSVAPTDTASAAKGQVQP